MPSSDAIWRIGLSFPACAISISEGTGRRSLSLVGTKGTFFPLVDSVVPAFLPTGFFRGTIFFETALVLFVLAIVSPLHRNYVVIHVPSVSPVRARRTLPGSAPEKIWILRSGFC